MRRTYSDEKPWKKGKILSDKPADVPLEQLYHTPLVSAQAKVRDLKKMAQDYTPSPQCSFYLELPDQGEDGTETENEDSD